MCLQLRFIIFFIIFNLTDSLPVPPFMERVPRVPALYITLCEWASEWNVNVSNESWAAGPGRPRAAWPANPM